LRQLALAARDAGCAEEDDEEEKRERARRERERHGHREPERAPAYECEQRGEHEREAETVREGGGEDRRGGDDREEAGCPHRLLAPRLANEQRERGGRGCRAEHCEQLDPDERRQRVVDEAVADERV